MECRNPNYEKTALSQSTFSILVSAMSSSLPSFHFFANSLNLFSLLCQFTKSFRSPNPLLAVAIFHTFIYTCVHSPWMIYLLWPFFVNLILRFKFKYSCQGCGTAQYYSTCLPCTRKALGLNPSNMPTHNSTARIVFWPLHLCAWPLLRLTYT